jgi:RHS repeat-associated protein
MTTKSPDPFDPIRAHGANLDQLYSYDGLQRLIDFQQGQLNIGNTAISHSTLTQDWDLDQVGNWDGFHQGVSAVLNQTRTHNRVNEITDISNGSGQPVWVDPAYDDAGNMTTTPRPVDPTDGFTLIYDAWNRITNVQTTDSTPKLVAQYAYDGRNHRITKQLYDTSGGLASTIKFFYNAAWQCLEERETPVGGSSSTSTYVWGQRYLDGLVCRDAVSGRLYAMQDRQYKTLAIINTGGTVQERYSYTPYGKTFVYDSIFTLRTASAFDWVYLYTGRRLDRETGLYYFRNRYYDSSLGRFCSRDPIGYDARSFSLYEYVLCNPLKYRDPTGKLLYYGNYCGPNSTLPGPGPIDGLDACCQTHDNCYLAAGASATSALPFCGNAATAACDTALSACATAFNCATIANRTRRNYCYLYRQEIIRYF